MASPQHSVSDDILSDPLKTSQSAPLLVAEYTEAHPVPTQMSSGHIEVQESDCADHPAVDSRTESRSPSTTVPEPEDPKNSSLNTNSQDISMQQQQDKGITGLANMRNTCYLNATLQAIRHNTELSAFFLEGRHEQWLQKKRPSPKVDLVNGYADVVKALWSASKPAYIRPQGFLQAVMPAARNAGFEQFLIPRQHDSHEFLTFLLDQLHEGLAEEVNIEIMRPTPKTPQDVLIQKALEFWKQSFGKQYSPLTEIAYGLLHVTITCKGCGSVGNNFETFNCLKLPIPQKSTELPTITSMLSEDFKEEEIEGYACDKCSPTRTIAIKKIHIWRLPRMIALVVKRFTADGRKIHTPIAFPSYESTAFTEYFSPMTLEPSKNQKYQCFAIVDHHGSAGGGHYVCQAKSPLSEKWNLFDDERTHSLESPQFGESSYIMLLKPSK